ncbi:MAG: type IV pilus secretin PilQ [Pseudomonadales bacterium]|nr:type IV pilus secretin PilQ [Pseudomonadales bacterium]
MKKMIYTFVLYSVALLGHQVAVADVAALKNLEFASLPGDQIELRLQFDSIPPNPKGYTIEKPARIALDLSGVESQLQSKYHNLGVGNARSLTVMGAKDRTRLIINLTELVPYSTVVVGHELIVTVGQDAQEKLLARDHAKGTASSTFKGENSTQGVATVVSAISEVDFRRGNQGEGQVIVTLTDPTASVDMREESGRIVVEFVGVKLPEQLHRRIDVVDFATPVKSIDAITEEGNAVLILRPEGDYEYLAYQADDKFTISVKPVAIEELEKRKKERFVFTGEKLSLNFQDIEVRSVLQLIADFTELNLVASDTVSGRITLRLQNVPWDQALDLILKTKGLDKRTIGNVMLVAPADEIAAREKLELETSKQVEELAPLRTEFIQVNYAKAADLAALLGGGDGGAGLLSSRGSATVDERTNTMLIRDTSAKIEDIRAFFSKLDIPVQQVLIEARVVVANASSGMDLGVEWGHVGLSRELGTNAAGETVARQDSNFTIGGSSNTIWDVRESGTEDDGVLTISRPDNLMVDLGVVGEGASSFALGFTSLGSGLLELELSALESSGHADIIATPKVLTADQQTARIASGTEIPYQEASSSGATSVAFKEAALSLEVTPHITPDGRIIMELQINQDTVGDEFAGIPSINTNNIQTNVLVNNGETVVLGGVFETSTVESITKTPFFGDLPVIGRFFRNTSKSERKQELLIFITPKIVKDVLATR